MLDSGLIVWTEEEFDGSQDEFEDELIERIEDHECVWKSIGNLTIRFNHLDGFIVNVKEEK